MRKHDATVDNLLSVELVTAGGELLTASPAQNEELFWGVRGAGANFGVVTAFEYRLHPVGPEVLAGPVFYALEDAPRMLRGYRDVVAGRTRRADHDRQPAPGAAAFVAPLRELAEPIADLLEPKPYLALQPHARGGVYLNFLGDEGPTASARPTAPPTTTG